MALPAGAVPGCYYYYGVDHGEDWASLSQDFRYDAAGPANGDLINKKFRPSIRMRTYGGAWVKLCYKLKDPGSTARIRWCDGFGWAGPGFNQDLTSPYAMSITDAGGRVDVNYEMWLMVKGGFVYTDWWILDECSTCPML